MRFKIWAASLASVIVLAVSGLAVWRVWPYVPILGMAILASVAIIFLAGASAGVILLVRLFYHADVIQVDQHGAYIRRFKTVTALPPLEAIPQKTSATKIVEAAPLIPSVSQLLEQGLIGKGQLLLGFYSDGTPRYGAWSDIRTFAVGGKSRSGKTVTMFFLILQAVLARVSSITVCDPHYTKPTGLANMLRPLGDFVTLVGTKDAILSAVDDFSAELERRIAGASGEPRLLVIDEWTRIARHKDMLKLIQWTVMAAGQEGAGYDMYIMLGGQLWQASASGGNKLKDSLHAAFAHRLDTRQSREIIPAQYAKKTPGLETGHCFLYDTDGRTEQLVMPLGVVADAVKVRQIITASLVPQVTAPPYNQRQIGAPGRPSASQVTDERKVLYMPEARREVAAEAAQEVSGSDTDNLTEDMIRAALRQVGKRIRSGESTNEIRKQLGVTGGRALQDINAALHALDQGESETSSNG